MNKLGSKMQICEMCHLKYSGKYASGRFCSEKCAKSFSTSKNKIDTYAKVSASLKITKFRPLKLKICGVCNKEFYTIDGTTRERKTCSKSVV